MTDIQDLPRLLSQWRQAEEKFYGAALSAPELYTAGLNLVRGLADSLSEATTVEALLEAYSRLSMATVAEIAERLEISHRDFLDYGLARQAAFYLRHREILEAQAKTEIAARLAEAEAGDEAWVTLYHVEQPGQGVTFFQRLELHRPDGLGLYSAIELDWEKGRVYVVEPLVLDPATGKPRRDQRPPDPRQEFRSHEEMQVALAALREKYSGEKA